MRIANVTAIFVSVKSFSTTRGAIVSTGRTRQVRTRRHIEVFYCLDLVIGVRMGVYLSARDVTVSEQLLYGPHIRYPHKLGCERVPEHVRVHGPSQGLHPGRANNPLDLAGSDVQF